MDAELDHWCDLLLGLAVVLWASGGFPLYKLYQLNYN